MVTSLYHSNEVTDRCAAVRFLSKNTRAGTGMRDRNVSHG